MFTAPGFTTEQEWRDLLIAVTRGCLCPPGSLGRRIRRCSVHQLLDEPYAVSRLVFYRRYALALVRAEWMEEPRGFTAGAA
jgi:hypothetical protein